MDGQAISFTTADHTIILSDIHLADAEPPHSKNPLWKKFKRPEFFIDNTFASFLEFIQGNAEGSIELVFNGDIFDFDSVMTYPVDGRFKMSWLEKARGLRSEEEKSRFKMRAILKDHSTWVKAVSEFIRKKNRVVFLIGNHDIELHWPSVQEELIEHLNLPANLRSHVRFVEWFYISNGDSLIEHGNQYDPYCLCSNPINPLIRNRHGVHIRSPFGNLAGKFMLNGMGLMNPHADDSYIRNSIWEYMVFYFKYVMRTQPFLFWTWFWSSMATLIVSVSEGFRPAISDPLTIADRVETIATKANADSRTVLALRELHAHPAYYDPIRIVRELWLDRAILLGLTVLVSFQLFAFLHVFVRISMGWFIAFFVLLLPAYVWYARSVRSDVAKVQMAAFESAPIAARIARVCRVVHGHTHLEKHLYSGDLEYLNTGTWSPAFRDVECTQPYGRKCFAWIKPGAEKRIAALYEWKDGRAIPVEAVVDSASVHFLPERVTPATELVG